MEKRFCVFGDSTASGFYDLEMGGWVNRLWLFAIKQDIDNDLYNLSISGGTTETILARFEDEAKLRRPNILIFQSGGNDAAYEKEGENWVAPEKFKLNIEEIIKRAKKIVGKIIFVGFKNVDESKTMPVSWINLYYKNENIKKYNEIMKNICEKEKVFFVDIFGFLEKEDFYDGLHPNSAGHQKIFEIVRNFLIENKILGK